MTEPDELVPAFLLDLERMLGVALLIHDVDPGPPATIFAFGMVDNLSTELVGRGARELDAWRDLAVNLAAWRNVDPRQIRMMLGA